MCQLIDRGVKRVISQYADFERTGTIGRRPLHELREIENVSGFDGVFVLVLSDDVRRICHHQSNQK